MWFKSCWSVMVVVFLTLHANARPADEFAAGTHSYGGYTIPYRIYTPAEYEDPGNEAVRYPMVLTLHGGGGRGDDNWTHITYTNNIAEVWALPNKQAANPCFVLAPQNNIATTGDWLALIPVIFNLMDELIDQGIRIDTDRVYVCGASWGGRGTFHAMNHTGPKNFRIAAGIPMCGSSTANYMSHIPADLPIWNFHSRNDDVVSVSYSRTMVSAFRNRGEPFAYTHCVSWPSVDDCESPMTSAQLDSLLAVGQKKLYTEFCCYGHALHRYAWIIPQLFTWIFSQNAGGTGNIGMPAGPPGIVFAPEATNPARVPVRFQAPVGGTGGRYTIWNTGGRMMCSIPVAGAGGAAVWPGMDAYGRMAAAGTYVAVWEGDDGMVGQYRFLLLGR